MRAASKAIGAAPPAGRRGRPRGVPLRNDLNDLSAAEWLHFTNTLWETRYPPDPTHRLRKAHGAMKPPEAMRDLIRFFTKKGERVLDPFAGVGGTLLGAALAGREAHGIELNPRWIRVYEEIRARFGVLAGALAPRGPGVQPVAATLEEGDCLERLRALAPASFDAIVTDPPYGAEHKVSGFRAETNFDMFNDGDSRDFGNAADMAGFLERMATFAAEAHRLLRPSRYLVVLIGDRYRRGEYVPLGAQLAAALRPKGFAWKGVKIWWNKATQRPLRPYALKQCFVPNITHQNILILRRTP